MMLSIEPPRDPGVGSSRHFAASGCAPIAARIPWWVGGGAAVTSSGPRWEMPCILYLKDRYMQSSSGFNLETCSFLVAPVRLQLLSRTSSQSGRENESHLFVWGFTAPETGLLFEPRRRISRGEASGTPQPPAPAGMEGRTSPPGPGERKSVKYESETRYVWPPFR